AVTTASMLGWVRAGIQATTIGERLSWQQRMLSQQIASLFVPWIEKAIDALSRLTEWFRKLSGEQQESIRWWVAGTIGLLGMLTVVPKLTAAFQGLHSTLLVTMRTNPALALAAGMAALLVQTEEGRTSLAEFGNTLANVFEPIAKLLVNVLGPTLSGISRFLSTATGQWAAFGTVAVAVLYRIAAAGQGAATAFLGWATAIGAAAIALAGVLTQMTQIREK